MFIFQQKEQTILRKELETIKPNKSVYVQQPNSNVYFLSDVTTCLSECKSKKSEKHSY